MPSAPVPDQPLATRDDIRRLEDQLAQLHATLNRIVHDQEIQFTRIAQVQADIDLIRGAWAQVKTSDESPYPGTERRMARPMSYIGPERRKTHRKHR